MVDKLEALGCPFCGAPGMIIDEDRVPGMAKVMCGRDCELVPSTDWHERDEAVRLWNQRATPANGEQVERIKRACNRLEAKYMGEEVTIVLAAARAATLPTPTEDARSRVGVLEEALETIASECDRMRKGTDDWFDLVEISLTARDALGNKETDRHG